MITMDKAEKKALRVFGYGLGIIIAFVVIRLGMQHGFTNGKFVALALAAFFILVTAVWLEAIKPLYNIWMKGARLIGEIVNFVLLSVIFYLFFGVIGVVLRIIRKDLLDEKIDKSVKSYWKPICSGPFEQESYTKQY